MHKCIIFLSSLLLMKYLKLSLPKGSLLDATILLISILLNEIVLLC